MIANGGFEMWNETKQQRLDALQQREMSGALTVEEKLTLENLFYELEQEEWQTLNPTLERVREEQIGLQKEISRTETQNVVLKAIALRQNDLFKRAKTQLKSLRNEHEALKIERERVLNELAA
jgi:hypothetical protein